MEKNTFEVPKTNAKSLHDNTDFAFHNPKDEVNQPDPTQATFEGFLTTEKQELLYRAISGIQQKINGSIWVEGTEYNVWDIIYYKNLPLHSEVPITEEDIQHVRLLSATVGPRCDGGWIVDDNGQPRFMIMSQWLPLFAQKKNDAAQNREQNENESEQKGGYEALGHDGKHSVVWSKGREVIVHISASDITSRGTLMSVCGSQWIEDQHRYGIYRDDPDTGASIKVGINFNKLSGEIIDACTHKGAYNAAAVRGAGVWKADDDNNVLVINSKTVFRTDTKVIGRIGTKFVYRHSRDLGVTEFTPAAGKKEIQSFLQNNLEVWQFKRKSDAKLLLGWMACGFMAGALSWRTPASLTGAAGSGKSTLMRLMSNIFGNACMLVDGGSTPAGVRQALGNDAIVYMSDEAEANGEQLAATLTFFRSASSGAEVLRGTQDQSGTSFTARFVGMLAGIVPPALNAADASRFMLLELNKLTVGPDAKPMPYLAGDSYEAQRDAADLGKRFFARMIQNWPRYQRCAELVKNVMRQSGDSSRFADTLGGPIAAAWVALFDLEMDEALAKEWLGSFDLSQSRELVQGTDDAGDLLQRIMSQSIMHRGIPMMLSQVAQYAVSSMINTKDFENLLAQYGIRADRTEGSTCLTISIWCNSPQLKELLSKSAWASGSFNKVLERIPGAKTIKSKRIGGVTHSSVISIPTDISCVHEAAPDISEQTAKTCANVSNINP